jgi:hypothetical protein
LKEQESILSRPAWAGPDGKPKYDFLVPPIVGADSGVPGQKKQVCTYLRKFLQFTHFDTIYAENSQGRIVPPL